MLVGGVGVSPMNLAPSIVVSTDTLSFGNVNVGVTKIQGVGVSNNGTAALTVSDISLSGANVDQFAVSPTSFTLRASNKKRLQEPATDQSTTD